MAEFSLFIRPISELEIHPRMSCQKYVMRSQFELKVHQIRMNNSKYEKFNVWRSIRKVDEG